MDTNKYSDKKIAVFLALLAFCVPFAEHLPHILAGELIASGDGMTAFYMMSNLKTALLNGEFPLWSPYLSMGVPFLEQCSWILYPPFILASLLPELLRFPFYLGVHYALAGAFLYLFLRRIDCKKYVSLAFSIIYLFTVHMGGVRKDHLPLIAASTFVAVILYFMECYLQTRRLKWLLAAAFAMAMQFYGGFLQYHIYTDLFCGVYLLTSGLHQKLPLKQMIRHGAAWLGAYLGFMAAPFLPTLLMVAAQISQGGAAMDYEAFTVYSLHPINLLLTVFPEIFGENIYAALGPYATSGIDIELFYGGACVSLFLIGIVLCKKDFKARFFYLGALVLYVYACMYNTGILGRLIYHIPILNMFRLPSRVLFIFTVCVLICAAKALSAIAEGEIALSFVNKVHGLMVAAMLLLAIVYYAVPWDAAWGIGERRPFGEVFLAPYAGMEVYLIVFYASVLLARKKAGKRTAEMALSAGLAVVTLLQLFPYHSISHYAALSGQTALPAGVNAEEAYTYKVWDTDRLTSLSENGNIYHGVMTLNSFTNYNLPDLYRILNGGVNAPLNYTGLYTSFANRLQNMKQDNDILSMLGVRYIIVPRDLENDISELETVNGYSVENETPVFETENCNLGEIRADTYQIATWTIDFDEDQDYLIELQTDFPDNVSWAYVDGYDSEMNPLFTKHLSTDSDAGTFYAFVDVDTDVEGEDTFRIVADGGDDVIVSKVSIYEASAEEEESPYALASSQDNYLVYVNENARPIIFPVQQAVGIADQDVSAMYSNGLGYDMLQTSYLSGYEGTVDLADADVAVSDIRLGSNRATAQVSAAADTFLNFSQNYYPGWQAFVDGQKTTLYQVDGIIQGAFVPAGEHTVEFRYVPVRVYLSLCITGLTMLLCVVYCIADDRKEKRTV